ncbi:hypothetical protein K438DRAFT_1024088 [Mycena galopus ATCC 62051]|nr:hypothetical protein K438DRAFT_1024088 [Mycena galopus ATCC 62051]
MSDPRLTSGNLRAAILHAPSLTHLEITSWKSCFDDTLVRALYYKDGLTPLVPHLHSLVLQGREAGTLTEDNLAGMIASRWWTDTELASHGITPPVARWTRVELKWSLGADFFNALKNIPSDVLIR